MRKAYIVYGVDEEKIVGKANLSFASKFMPKIHVLGKVSYVSIAYYKKKE